MSTLIIFLQKAIAHMQQTFGIYLHCIGNREQIRQEVDGRLCPLDPESLCREILWMIDHPEECRVYGARAREKTLYSTKGFTEFLGLLDGAQQREEMSCETETVLLSR